MGSSIQCTVKTVHSVALINNGKSRMHILQICFDFVAAEYWEILQKASRCSPQKPFVSMKLEKYDQWWIGRKRVWFYSKSSTFSSHRRECHLSAGAKGRESEDVRCQNTSANLTVQKKLIIHCSQIVMRLSAEASRSTVTLWVKGGLGVSNMLNGLYKGPVLKPVREQRTY